MRTSAGSSPRAPDVRSASAGPTPRLLRLPPLPLRLRLRLPPPPLTVRPPPPPPLVLLAPEPRRERGRRRPEEERPRASSLCTDSSESDSPAEPSSEKPANTTNTEPVSHRWQQLSQALRGAAPPPPPPPPPLPLSSHPHALITRAHSTHRPSRTRCHPRCRSARPSSFAEGRRRRRRARRGAPSCLALQQGQPRQQTNGRPLSRCACNCLGTATRSLLTGGRGAAAPEDGVLQVALLPAGAGRLSTT
eukprot:COSAG01_NODE_1594_length_9789_cov_98.477399_10_plen_248_part_00